jgi:hypothetical protein
MQVYGVYVFEFGVEDVSMPPALSLHHLFPASIHSAIQHLISERNFSKKTLQTDSEIL